MRLTTTVGFLGFGNMGAAILEGLLDEGALAAHQAMVYDPSPARREAASNLGAALAESEATLAEACETLVLAVKPQTMPEALSRLRPGIRPEARVISIAAGVSIASIQSALGGPVRVVRVMPNTPALARSGAAGIALGPNCSEEDGAIARALFEAVGIAEFVEEKDIDAVTALSGSGPAYFFYLTECLVDAAVAEGLNPEVAARLAAHTLLGAGKLLTQSGDTAAALREKVTSKGGTTEAALARFQAEGLAEAVRAGVAAAAARSRELGA